MRFWDASALVPLIVAEPFSDRARSWLAEDAHVVTWAWTLVEITRGVERRVREGKITRTQRRALIDRLHALADMWDEVTDVLAVRRHALPILARHQLAAADAAQLAAALLVAETGPATLEFVCLDERLAAAAELEGLRILPEPV
ncbi:MAG TPA: type II toxin-antitoxin system VapC family toxin [Acidimicrobiia bacterium]